MGRPVDGLSAFVRMNQRIRRLKVDSLGRRDAAAAATVEVGRVAAAAAAVQPKVFSVCVLP